MNIGINTFLFTSPFTDRSTKLFAQFARWGFDCVEIAVEQPQHINPAHVKRELKKHGLQPGPVCACFPPDRDLRGTKAQQKNAVDYVCRLVDLAVLLGSSGVAGPMYSATGRADAVEPGEHRKQWATVTKHLRRIGNYAEARGKKIFIEPLNRFETSFINLASQEYFKSVKRKALKARVVECVFEDWKGSEWKIISFHAKLARGGSPVLEATVTATISPDCAV